MDDGGAAALGVVVTDGLAADGPAVVGDADGLAVVGDTVDVAVGAAELLVGAGVGGPKQAESENRVQSPRTLNAVSLGLVMMPPFVRAQHFRSPASTYAGTALQNRDFSPTPRHAHPAGRVKHPRRN